MYCALLQTRNNDAKSDDDNSQVLDHEHEEEVQEIRHFSQPSATKQIFGRQSILSSTALTGLTTDSCPSSKGTTASSVGRNTGNNRSCPTALQQQLRVVDEAERKQVPAPDENEPGDDERKLPRDRTDDSLHAEHSLQASGEGDYEDEGENTWEDHDHTWSDLSHGEKQAASYDFL
eukprot:SAG31_NODE_2041_length_6590_cov_2.334155_7_plen_176_part_00